MIILERHEICYTEIHEDSIHLILSRGIQNYPATKELSFVMTSYEHIPALPSLDDMLQPLLLLEEGEHEFSGEEEGLTELRELFFPVTRHCTYLNHAANGPLPRPTARTLHDYVDDTSLYGNINFERWSAYEAGSHRRLANLIHARPDQIALTYSTGDGFMTIAQDCAGRMATSSSAPRANFPAMSIP